MAVAAGQHGLSISLMSSAMHVASLQEQVIEDLKKEIAVLQGLVMSGNYKINEGSNGDASSAELESLKKENEKLKMRVNVLKRVSSTDLLVFALN